MTSQQHLNDLIDECNSLSLRLMTAQAELSKARHVITTLYDTVIELAAPATAPKRGVTFEQHVDSIITLARPWIDQTARNVRAGVINNFEGRQLLLEVLPSGSFNVSTRDNESDAWSLGTWGWLS